MTTAPPAPLTVDLSVWPGVVLGVSAPPAFEVVASNGQLERLIGEAVVGRPIMEMLDADSCRTKWDRIASARVQDTSRSWELVLRGASGLLDPRAFTALPRDAESVLWLVEHPVDTRLERLSGEVEQMNSELATTQRALFKEQSRLAAALEEVKRSNTALDEFAHAVSHDLKAPLRAIIDYSEILGDTGLGLDDEHRGYLARVSVLAHKMRRMIDGVLNYARAGRATSAHEVVDTAALIRELVEFLAPPPDMIIDVAGDLPTFSLERVPFEQVFRNLLSNAIKYRSAEPRVSVTAVDDGAYWRFVVADNGPGIPASQADRIWGLFQTTRPQDGTGIGLALVKRITEAQGGRVSLESSPGHGARFTVSWPKDLQPTRVGA